MPKKPSVGYFLKWKPNKSFKKIELELEQANEKDLTIEVDKTVENDQPNGNGQTNMDNQTISLITNNNLAVDVNTAQYAVLNFLNEAYQCQKSYESKNNWRQSPQTFLYQYNPFDNCNDQNINRLLQNTLTNFKFIHEELYNQSSENLHYKTLLKQNENFTVALKYSNNNLEQQAMTNFRSFFNSNANNFNNENEIITLNQKMEEIESLIRENNESQLLLKSLQKTLAQKEELIDYMTKNSANFETCVSEELVVKIADQKEEIKKLKETILFKESLITEYLEENKNFEKEMREMKICNQEAIKLKTKMVKEKEDFTSEIEKINNENVNLKLQLQQQSVDKANYESFVFNYELNAEQTNIEKKNLIEKLNQAELRFKEIQVKYEKQSSELIEEKKKLLDSELIEFEIKIANIETEKRDLNEELTKIKLSCQNRGKNIMKLKKVLALKETALVDSNKKIAELESNESELCEYRSKMPELEFKINQLEDEKVNLSEELSDKLKKLNSVNEKINYELIFCQKLIEKNKDKELLHNNFLEQTELLTKQDGAEREKLNCELIKLKEKLTQAELRCEKIKLDFEKQSEEFNEEKKKVQYSISSDLNQKVSEFKELETQMMNLKKILETKKLRIS